MPATSTSPIGPTLFWAGFHLRRNLRKRAFIIWLVALALVMIALRFVGSGPEAIMADISLAYVTPLLALFFGTGVLREEIEDQTLTYGFTRPVRRAWLYYGRVFASAGPVVVLAAPCAALAGVGTEASIRFAAAAALAALAYTSLFALFGLVVKWATWFGIGYFLVWELGVGYVPGFLGRLTISAHTRGLADAPVALGPLQRFWEPPDPVVALVSLLGVTVVALAIGGRIVERREFPLSR